MATAWFQRLARHLSYADAAATIALFVSLGGASYAAITLSDNSVGARQLRPRAVNVGALAFPLGAASITDYSAHDLTKGGCNSPLPPGTIAPPCPPPFLGGDGSVRPLHLTVGTAGRLLVSVVAGMRNAGASGTTATITVAIIVDGHALSRRQVMLLGGEQVQVPLQALVSIPAGKHTLGFGDNAEYSSRGPGDVFVQPVSIIATTLPSQ
jgi:hypothetical protein